MTGLTALLESFSRAASTLYPPSLLLLFLALYALACLQLAFLFLSLPQAEYLVFKLLFQDWRVKDLMCDSIELGTASRWPVRDTSDGHVPDANEHAQCIRKPRRVAYETRRLYMSMYA